MTDTDATPILTLVNCTESPATIKGELDPIFTRRIPLVYVTTGPASDLQPIREYFNRHDGSVVLPAANLWGYEELVDVLAPLPKNSRCVVNLEYWNGRDGWTLDQFACAMARFKAVRPDIWWSLYAAHTGRNTSEAEATAQFRAFDCGCVYAGKWVEPNLARIPKLMEVSPDALVLTGWVLQMGGYSIAPSEEQVRDVMRKLFLAGVTHLGLWMAPLKPGILRYPEMIVPMGHMAVEEFARVHGTPAGSAAAT